MRAAFGLGLVAAALAVAEPSSRPSGASAVEQRTFKLHHRFLPPSTSSVGSTQPEWTEFASFPAGQSSTLSETAAVTHLDTTVNGGTEIKGDAEGWYQVGVETDGGWVTGSTRAVSPIAWGGANRALMRRLAVLLGGKRSSDDRRAYDRRHTDQPVRSPTRRRACFGRLPRAGARPVGGPFGLVLSCWERRQGRSQTTTARRRVSRAYTIRRLYGD